MPSLEVPTTDINLGDTAMNQDPYPALHEIRELGPVVYNPSIERWLVAGYDNARMVLGDQKRFPQDAQFFLDLFHAPTLETVGDPRHQEIRSAYNPIFNRGAVQTRRERIEQLVDERMEAIVGKLKAGEAVDMIPSMTGTLPPTVVAEVLGVGTKDLPRFKVWANDMCGIVEAITELDEDRRNHLRSKGDKSIEETCAYAQIQLDQRRAEGNDGDMTGVLALSPVAETMPPEEQQAAIALLVMAGDDNTQKLLSHAIIALARHPEQRREIVADRSLLPGAIEEIIRWTGPVQSDPRMAGKDAEIGGITVPEGDLIMVLVGIANRDPERWEKPDEFDIHRPFQSNLEFGFGTHICAGMNLAKLEAEIMLGRMLDQIPDYKLADEKIDYGSNFFVRGPSAVRVTL